MPPGAMESDYPADEEMFKGDSDKPKVPTPQPSPKRKPGEQGRLSLFTTADLLASLESREPPECLLASGPVN